MKQVLFIYLCIYHNNNNNNYREVIDLEVVRGMWEELEREDKGRDGGKEGKGGSHVIGF